MRSYAGVDRDRPELMQRRFPPRALADQPGLATLIDERAPRREVHEARIALDEQLGDAAATLGDSANRATVVTNSAILVFREGSRRC